MTSGRRILLRWAIAVLVMVALALALTQTGRYALYYITNSEGVRGEPIDQPYPDPSVAIGTDNRRATHSLPLRIAVAGDVGTGGDAEYATAASMDRIEGDNDYAALLLLGDNVYPDGDPADVERKVLDPFAQVLDGDTQLLPVLGNHDHDDGYGDEQVTALGMPARWYSTRIDDTLIVSLDSNRIDDADQLAWLGETLESNDSVWTIVQFHHPPYSGGWHGSDQRVRDVFVPLFEAHDVDLVLSGHEHDYQRTREINGVTYVVSGAAAKRRGANLVDFTEIAVSTYHFVDLTITADRLDIRTIDHGDRVFDHVTLLANES